MLPLSELLNRRVPDGFARRKLEREILAMDDAVAQRLAPLEHIGDIPERERRAALDAVATAFTRVGGIRRSAVRCRRGSVLADRGHEDELRVLMASDDYPRRHWAGVYLARLLHQQERAADLRDLADAHIEGANELLVGLLARQEGEHDLRMMAAAGDLRAGSALAALLRRQGREHELRLDATAGESDARRHLPHSYDG